MSSKAPKLSSWAYFNNNKTTSIQNKPDIIYLESSIANAGEISTTDHENVTTVNKNYNAQGEDIATLSQFKELEAHEEISYIRDLSEKINFLAETEVKGNYKIEGSLFNNIETEYTPCADKLLWKLTAVLTSSLHQIPILSNLNSGVIQIDRNTPCANALQIMMSNNITSIPITYMKKYWATIDLADIATYLARHFASYKFITFAEFDAVYKETLKFHQSTDLVKSHWFRNNYLDVIPSDHSLFRVFEKLARKSVNRVTITNSDNRIEAFITETMAMKYILKNIDMLSIEVRNRNVKEMTLYRVDLEPILIRNDDRTISAFNNMVDYNVSVLGVISSTGSLVDTISVRDLRGLQMESDSIWRLFTNINEFKANIRKKYHLSTEVVKIKMNESIENCINLIVKYHVHALFAVDENDRPLRYVSIRDILYNVIFRPEPLKIANN